jgi:hypothetical protein
MRSSTGIYAIDRGRCALLLVIASEIPRRKVEAMEARAG